jgi:hypothetical protein
MRLYLINPSNPLVSIVKVKESRWNRYRVWKPLSLMVLGGLTPPEWEISIVDENLGAPDYPAMPRPDLVGITAFTSQANRAYEVATHFRRLGVPVVMGGIHATMCQDEVMERVDSVVTGEAEGIWLTSNIPVLVPINITMHENRAVQQYPNYAVAGLPTLILHFAFSSTPSSLFAPVPCPFQVTNIAPPELAICSLGTQT